MKRTGVFPSREVSFHFGQVVLKSYRGTFPRDDMRMMFIRSAKAPITIPYYTFSARSRVVLPRLISSSEQTFLVSVSAEEA